MRILDNTCLLVNWIIVVAIFTVKTSVNSIIRQLGCVAMASNRCMVTDYFT